MKSETMKLYCDVEEATLPIEQVITLLGLISDTYDLGNNELDEFQKLNLVSNHRTIDSMLILAQNTLAGVVAQIEKLSPTRVTEAAS